MQHAYVRKRKQWNFEAPSGISLAEFWSQLCHSYVQSYGLLCELLHQLHACMSKSSPIIILSQTIVLTCFTLVISLKFEEKKLCA